MQVPSLESTQKSEGRKTYKKTDSELFHETVLDKRVALAKISNESIGEVSFPNATINDQTQINKNQSKFFTQFTCNAVYPAECDQLSDRNSSENILDASFVIDHMTQMPKSNRSNQRLSTDLNTSIDLNDTVVDEDLIMNLSQWSQDPMSVATVSLNETLNEEESDVLDIMRQLEEQEQQQDNFVENDSILAPFSQRNKDLGASLSQRMRKQEQNVTLNEKCDKLQENEDDQNEQSVLKRSFADDYFNDSDDDLLNDFSMCFNTLAAGER